MVPEATAGLIFSNLEAEEINTGGTTAFSQKTKEECIEFIINNDITIPNDFIDNADLGRIVKDIIVEVEKNPNVEFAYNYKATQKFAEDIKTAVLAYRNIKDNISNYPVGRAIVSELPNNTLYGEWQDDYGNYNCYSYAINYIEGDFNKDRGRKPGQMSNGEYSINLPIAQMAELVRNDLISIGYSDVYVTNTRPAFLCEGEKLICIRKGETDFHFMKYHSDGDFWTHKPGGSAILKYNHQPSNDVIWLNEFIDQYGYANVNEACTYTSEIYYIIYDWEGFCIEAETIINFVPPVDFNGYVNLPSISVIVPVVLPFTFTFTPGTPP